MLQHKTTTPGGCQQAAAFVLPLTDKQGRGERCKGISGKGTIMCRNTAESRKLFYSDCILNIRAAPHNSRLTAQAPLRRLRHGICVAKMLDNVGLRYPHRASGAKAPRTLRPLPLLRFAVSATGGAHLCSIQYYLRFWLSSCRTSLAVSALRIMRYCLRNGQKREKPVAGVFKIKAARYPFCSGTGQPVWWFGRKKIKSFGKNLKLSPLHCQRQCRQ